MKCLLGIYFLVAVLISFLPRQVMAVSIDELNQAIATAPTERLPSFYIYRSRAYFDLGDEINGLADLETSLRVKPSSEAYLARGEYFQKTNRLDAAISDFSAALAVNNASVKAYRLRSAAYYEKKKYVQAIIDASHVKMYDEEDPFALNMIEKCYVQTSPKERIVLRSSLAYVMEARKGLTNPGSNKAYLPSPSLPKNKGDSATAKREKNKCGPRRKS